MSRLFAIAGVQQPISAIQETVTTVSQRIDVMMSIYPWV
jgi:hypothetical protein